jgi:hypothetical protein
VIHEHSGQQISASPVRVRSPLGRFGGPGSSRQRDGGRWFLYELQHYQHCRVFLRLSDRNGQLQFRIPGFGKQIAD